MLSRSLVVRFVTISLTTTIKSTKAAFFSVLPTTTGSSSSSSTTTTTMLRRSPRRSYAVATELSRQKQEEADGSDSAHDNTKESYLQTPKKRRRKAFKNHDEDKVLPFTPSTPDLITSSSPLAVTTDSIASSSNSCDNPFVDLNVPPAEFRPSATLTTGQSFHWRALPTKDVSEATASTIVDPVASSSSAWGVHDATDWIGILRATELNESLVVHIRETPTTTMYKILYAPPGLHDTDTFLREYFQLHVSLEELYECWSKACPRLHKIAQCIPGVRMLQQDPWETLISFICCTYYC